MNADPSPETAGATLALSLPPAALYRRETIVDLGAYPTSTLIVQEVIHVHPPENLSTTDDRASLGLLLNLMIFIGTICMFVATIALTGSAPMTPTLKGSAISGIIGTLSAGAGALFIAKNAHIVAWRALFLSCVCAIVGSLGVVAETQPWEVTAVAGGCAVVVLLGVVWWLREKVKGFEDAEVGLVRR
ncbi:unnamed protein product [Peniophora sp. CBMAI 1063]|nr:unnamed protein product [Peniophora sp. CBMAI 1063]